ncbi:MAG TPA: substrate-binding domain-containing protein [Conexibacter sp.]|nr:substrate-binding domain-containing protein [Conexibacter sp.]
MSRSAALAAAFVLAAAAAVGCGSEDSGDSTTSAAAAPGGSFVPQRAATVRGDLPPQARRRWSYDAATGRFAVVDGDASGYRPALAPPREPFTLAYMDPWAANQFAIPIREGVERHARRLGLGFAYCDTAFRAERAVECAELLARQRPGFAIAGNWQAGASAAVMRVFDDARIPTASIDVWQPNSIFFGADNYSSGELGGRAAGEYARQAWDCRDVWLFLGENKEEGEAAAQRLAGFADGVQEVCGALPADRIQRERMAAGTGDQALTVTTDWLTAHPQAERVLATTLDDERASGIAKAFAASGTAREARVVGLGCDAVGVEVVKQAPAEQNRYLGCVAFFPDKYAEHLVSLALDVVGGRAVPEEVHVEHELLTHATIAEHYP